ncbi:MAG: DUF4213 domain-containing protein [Coriobacteriia bacterium]|nr:DUF4213 domain-containing protein [Coriobacteriia bacterium]
MIKNTQDLMAYTLKVSSKDEEFPQLERIACGQKWLGVKLSDGRCGRSFIFYGEHAVYGPMTPSDCKDFAPYVGKGVDEVIAEIGEQIPSHALERPKDVLLGCLATALINALAQHLNAPKELERSGCKLLGAPDFELFHSDDIAVMIGAGMLLREAIASCKEVHVIDMRTKEQLSTLDLRLGETIYGPKHTYFHGPEDTEELLDAIVQDPIGQNSKNGSETYAVDIRGIKRDY